MNGLEATRRIKEADPHAAVLILSGADDEHMLARAVQAGAAGLISKTEGVVDVASTVRRAHRGEAIHDDDEVEVAQRRFRHRRDVDDDVKSGWTGSRRASSRSCRPWRAAATPPRSPTRSG